MSERVASASAFDAARAAARDMMTNAHAGPVFDVPSTDSSTAFIPACEPRPRSQQRRSGRIARSGAIKRGRSGPSRDGVELIGALAASLCRPRLALYLERDRALERRRSRARQRDRNLARPLEAHSHGLRGSWIATVRSTYPCAETVSRTSDPYTSAIEKLPDASVPGMPQEPTQFPTIAASRRGSAGPSRRGPSRAPSGVSTSRPARPGGSPRRAI